ASCGSIPRRRWRGPTGNSPSGSGKSSGAWRRAAGLSTRRTWTRWKAGGWRQSPGNQGRKGQKIWVFRHISPFFRLSDKNFLRWKQDFIDKGKNYIFVLRGQRRLASKTQKITRWRSPRDEQNRSH